MSDLELKSRHLGLIQSIEVDDINNRIQMAADIIKQNIDLNLLVNLMEEVDFIPVEYPPVRKITVAVARDRPFPFTIGKI